MSTAACFSYTSSHHRAVQKGIKIVDTSAKCSKGRETLQVIHIQSVPLATEPGISLIILPLMRILQRNLKRTTDTFLFISHTTKVLLFKFLCNIFIGFRIIKEMSGSVASGTHCIYRSFHGNQCVLYHSKVIFIIRQGTNFVMKRSLSVQNTQTTNFFLWKDFSI